MKKLIALFVGVMSMGLTFGQAGDLDERYLELLLQGEKRTIINSGMALTTEEAPAFWALYDAYEAEFSTISSKRMEMLNAYADAFPNVSDELANSLVTDMYKVNANVYKLRHKYAKKMAKECSPQTAARFMQLDDLINTAIKLVWGSELPLIGDN